MRLVSRFLSLKYKYTSLRGLCLFCVNKGRWTTYSINIGYKQGVKISRSKTQEITSENERKQKELLLLQLNLIMGCRH